jgi:hypothetical protein
VTTLPSHAGNGIAEATLAVVRCCYRGDLAVERCHYQVMLVTTLLSHTCDGIATQGCTDYDKVVQPPSSEHRGFVTT